MDESENGGALSAWNAPECPFTIEYSPRTLDDIRLAVVEAFFSLPRGGAEIGGILCGKWDGKRLTITDFAALDCEHAFGPSFTLSPRDESRLADLMAASGESGPRPVGWYHSHTRSEIFLSDADQDIHRRFFPDPWQVALVLKPHTFHPTRAGFFFRDSSGSIHGEASYAEFVLTPLAVKPAPSEIERTGVPANPAPPTRRVSEPMAHRQSASQPSLPAPAKAVEEETAPSSSSDLVDMPGPSRLWRLKAAAAVLLACGVLGAIALWLPRALSRAQPQASAPAQILHLGLNVLDAGGQLQIRWDPNSLAVQRASGGVLGIGIGNPFPQEIPLDKAHLLSGAFTFARQTERVDVSLALTQPDGSTPREVTTFIGKLPDSKQLEEQAARDQRDKLAKQVAKIQSDLNAEIERNAMLQKTVDQMSKQLQAQQRAHPQVPGKK